MSQTSASNGSGGNGTGKVVRTDKAFLDRFKEFGPSSWAVDHPTMVMVTLAIILIMGLYSYFTTPQESFPEIEIPSVAVNTMYPGVSPADMESLITRPLEEDLSTISDIKTMTSSSTEGYSSVMIEFQTTVNMDDALAKVREKVDLAKADLPPEAEEPQIFEFNFSEGPVVQVNLAGDYGLVRLKEIGDDLKDELEQIPSVLRVDLRGGLEREVSVEVDLAKLQYYNVAIGDVIEAIGNENVNIPGGSIDVGNSKYLVRVDGEFADPALIEDVVVALEGGKPVYVRDIASVDFGFAERESYARLEGSSVVTLDVIKRSGTNIIEVSQAVRATVAAASAEFPPSTRVEFAMDTSEDIAMMVASLENNIVTGLILIVGVLLFFLGLANSVFVALAHVLKDRRPDLVLSGINHGPNVGYDVYYSGTVGAAREGLIHGVPSVAFSLVARAPQPFDAVRPIVLEILRRVRDQGIPPEVLLNVNIPGPREDEPAGWLGVPGILGLKTTTLGRRFYTNEIVFREDPRGRPYFWIGGAWPRIEHVEGTDCESVRQGWVSVTPLGLDPTDHGALAAVAPLFTDAPKT